MKGGEGENGIIIPEITQNLIFLLLDRNVFSCSVL